MAFTIFGGNNKNEAKINVNFMLKISPHDSTDLELFSKGFLLWKENEDENINVYRDEEEDDWDVFFSLYSAQSFFDFYKNLIIEGIHVPDTDGDLFDEISLDIAIQHNKFKLNTDGNPEFSKNNKAILQETDELRNYKNVIINSTYFQVLYLLGQWIFYSYSTSDITNDRNIKETYEENIDLMGSLIDVYCKEHEDTPKQEIPVLPDERAFIDQKTEALYIPALSLNDEIENNDDYSENGNNYEDENDEEDPYEQENKRSKSEIPSESEESYERENDEEDPYANEYELTVTDSEEASFPTSINEFSDLPLDVDEKKISNAFKLMIESGSFLHSQPIFLQKFDLSESVGQVPDDISEAIKNGNFDNQRYIQQMTNEFKSSANQLIINREQELNLAFERSLIDMYTTTYQRINSEYAELFNEYSDDKDLEDSAREYYVERYKEQQKRLILDKNDEIENERQHLEKKMQAKLKEVANDADKRYRHRLRELEEEISKNSVELFNESRSKRNNELKEQMDKARQSSFKQLNLDIENHAIEFKHKASKGSQMIFTYFNKQLDNSRERWIVEVSKLINKQIQLDEANRQLKQAQIDASNIVNDSAKNEEQSRLIDHYRSNATKLRNEINDISTDLLKSQDQNDVLNAEKQQINKVVSGLKKQLEIANQENDQNNDEMEELKHKYYSLEHDFKKTQNELNRVVAEQGNYDDINDSKFKDLSHKYKQANKKIVDTELENEELKRELKKYQDNSEETKILRQKKAEQEMTHFQQREKATFNDGTLDYDEQTQKEAKEAKERNDRALDEARKQSIYSYERMSASEKSRLIESKQQEEKVEMLQRRFDEQQRQIQKEKTKHFWNK